MIDPREALPPLEIMKTCLRRGLLVLVCLLLCSISGRAASDGPNFIIIFADDQGYGDLGCYGSPDIETPNIDRMAAEGVRFTSFYAAPFCGPSRAALMTGCYPPRVNLAFNHIPEAKTGLNHDETTIAEVLKDQGYKTGMIGKWHLGDHAHFLPLQHGFDRFFGLPYSNDMWPFHPRMPLGDNPDPRHVALRERALKTGFAGQGRPFAPGDGFPQDLPLYLEKEVIETNPDQTQLTTRYTDYALDFITENREKPFFLYMAHAMPHVPLYVSDKFKGKSKRGLYGDVMEEVDWSVGQILGKLKELEIDGKTLIVYTSDNGPWLQYGIDGGSAGPLRGGKGSAWEGGMRVPAVMRWPGQIPAGIRTSEIACNMDLLPTFARLAGSEVKSRYRVDGRDIWPLMSGQENATSPHEQYYYYGGRRDSMGPPILRAVRQGQWKLHFDRRPGRGGAKPIELYDLSGDVSESLNLIDEHPELVSRIQAAATAFNKDLGAHMRPIGRLP